MINKKNIFIFLLLFIGIGTTYAYYKNIFTPFNNVFSVGHINTVFKTEYTSSLCSNEDKEEDYNFAVKNTSDKPFMVRISYTDEWVDDSGNKISENITDGGKIGIPIFSNSADWKKIGNYYYYKYQIDKGETSSELIKGFKITKNYDGENICFYDLSLNEEVCSKSPVVGENYKYKVN